MEIPDATLPLPGRLIAGKYRLDRLIGKGGMGVVYAAHHELLAQPVAIKLLLGNAASDPAASARFVNEARAAARIPSDHVVRVLDVGLDGDRPYLVMEYLEGRDLAHLLEERGRLPEAEAIDYVLQAIEAVAQAHALGIIHRDLKPSNLFLTERANGERVVKVLDFGIAKAFGAAASTQVAAVTTQGLIGSPAYMAPEYVRSAKSIDTRADIWAFGVILYELLSGHMPFSGENAGEVLAAILEQTPKPLGSVRADLSPRLVAVVTKCLQRKPDDRWKDLSDVAEALAPLTSRRSPSIAAIRETTRVLRARPPSPDASNRMRALQRDDETVLAAADPAKQTNGSWTEGIRPAPAPSRGRKLAAAAGGALALLSVAAVWMAATVRERSLHERAPTVVAAPPPVNALPLPAAVDPQAFPVDETSVHADPAAPPTPARAVPAHAKPYRRPPHVAAPIPSVPSLARDRR